MSGEMHCAVYHDERIVPNKWLYHGLLLVPKTNRDQFLELLINARTGIGCESVMHFHGLDDTAIDNQLAESWTGLFCNELSTLSYFYIIGVDYQKLARKLWPSHRVDKIYNRFFQIGLYSSLKWFFLNKHAGFSSVTVSTVFSHAKDRSPEDIFSTQAIEDISFKSSMKRENIRFENSEIMEIETDHRVECSDAEERQIMQYVDLITGGFSQVFDYTSKHRGKCIVADTLCHNSLPFDIIYPGRPKFHSPYYKRYAVAFFPRTKLSEAEILGSTISLARNQFYHYRDSKYLNRIQPSLFA
jgi:hypothetical protein